MQHDTSTGAMEILLLLAALGCQVVAFYIYIFRGVRLGEPASAGMTLLDEEDILHKDFILRLIGAS